MPSAFHAKSESTLASLSPAPSHFARSPLILITWSARSHDRSSKLAYPWPNARPAQSAATMCGTPSAVRRIVAWYRPAPDAPPEPGGVEPFGGEEVVSLLHAEASTATPTSATTTERVR